MRFSSLFLAISFLLSIPTTLYAQPATANIVGAQEDLTSDIKSFIEILNASAPEGPYDPSFFGAANFVSEAKLGFFGGQQIWREWQQTRGERRVEVTNVETLELKEPDAKIRVSYTLSTKGLKSESLSEVVVLHLARSRNAERRMAWQIVPNAALAPDDVRGVMPHSIGSAPILNVLAMAVSGSRQNIESLRGAQSVQHLKILGLAVMQFLQDFDQSFSLDSEFAQEAFAPYMPRSNRVWQIPGYPSESYVFNDNLSRGSVGAIKQPARTVLFYEGKEEQPLFRYNGKAAIAFADGRAALITPDEMKTIVWTP